MIKFSVVIPTHNRVDSLRRLITSLLDQTMLPSQLIVINDSVEPLPEDIALSVKGSGIQYVQKNINVASAPVARNEGINLANGDVVVLIDDDVELYGDTLECFYQIYKLDIHGVVGGVGALIIESKIRNRFINRLWWFLARLFGQNAWCTRRNISRYVPLSTPLKKMIKPAWKISGSLITMRRKVAQKFQFDESMHRVKGYTLGDDREFASRLAAGLPMFNAINIKVLHHSHPQGRPGCFQIGKMKLPSLKYIVRKTGQYDAGARLIIGYEVVGMMTLHFFWSFLNRKKRNLYISAGMAASLAENAGNYLKSIWYGGKTGE